MSKIQIKPLSATFLKSLVEYKERHNGIDYKMIERIELLHSFYNHFNTLVKNNNSNPLNLINFNYQDNTKEVEKKRLEKISVIIETFRLLEQTSKDLDVLNNTYVNYVQNNWDCETKTFGELLKVVKRGKGSFNEMKSKGIASDSYDIDKGFVFPIYNASTKNNHIVGYSKEYNWEGEGIKFSGVCPSKKRTTTIKGKVFLCNDSVVLESTDNKYNDKFMLVNLDKWFFSTMTGATIKNSNFRHIENKKTKIPKDYEKAVSYLDEINNITNELKTILNGKIEDFEKIIKIVIKEN